MIKFEKVSYNTWRDAYIKNFELDEQPIGEKFEAYMKDLYDNIKLPQRGTRGSAGYDFYAPYDISIKHGHYELVPLGIRFVTDRDDVVLLCMPRSGLGFKFMTRLANTTGVIDSDYQYADNEGHIMLKMTSEKDVEIKQGQGIMQGIIMPYIITDDDSANADRTGGFGSTDRR